MELLVEKTVIVSILQVITGYYKNIVKSAEWDQRFATFDRSKPDFLLAHVTNPT